MTGEPVFAFEIKAGRSSSLDALRGVAVLLVVFHHWFLLPVGIPMYDFFIPFFRSYGMLGVDLFFLLSGFCIHNAYRGTPSRFSTKKYLLRRWWRIYPPYFFALALAVLMNLATNYLKWKSGAELTVSNFGPLQVLTHIFLIHNFSQKTTLTISGPFWTIATEMQYYLLYLVLRPLFYSRKGWAVLFVSAFLLYFAAWHIFYLPYAVQPLNPFCYWIEWIAGAFLAYAVKNGVIVPNRHNGLLALILTVFFLILSVQFFEPGQPELSRIAITACFASLIIFFLAFESIWARKPLAWLPRLGIFSYSIYLVHFIFLDRIRVFLIPRAREGMERLLLSVSAIAFCLFVSYGFYIFFEKPFLKKAASIAKY